MQIAKNFHLNELAMNVHKKVSGIYIIKNIINDCIYIGSAVDFYKRYHHHKEHLLKNKHGNNILQNFCNKYGFNSLIFEVLKLCPKEELIKTEQYYMDLLNPSFNILKIAGSNLGVVFSDEIRQKISKALKGRKGHQGNLGKKCKDETKQKIALANKGKVRSEQHKLNMSIGRIGLKLSDNHKQSLSIALKGRKVSAETRKKIGDANKGMIRSEERRKQHSIIMKGRTSPMKGRTTPIEVRMKQSLARKEYYKKRNNEIIQKL